MSTAGVEKAFIMHVHELRRRLSWSAAVFVLAGLAAFTMRKPIVDILVKPLNQPLYYSAPSGSFDFIIKLSVACGIVITLPVLIYNLIRFIEPAFEKKLLGRKAVLLVMGLSLFFTWAGVIFAYKWILPTSFKFFSDFTFGPINPLISTTDYLNFIIGTLVTFALIFQLPLLLLTFNSINKFPPGSLSRWRRHVIVGSLALALFLPFSYDPITQFIVALPVIVLFETSIASVWLVNRKANKQHLNAEKVSEKQIKQTTEHTAAKQQPDVFIPAAVPKPHSVPVAQQQFAHRRPIQMG